jgi:rSAM/selenodomain-associated transferase 2
MAWLSVVVPVLNDAAALRQLFDDLDAVGAADVERIVVDGGSSDASFAVAEQRAQRALAASRGRATQLATGVAVATGEWLWLLHADSRIDAKVWRALQGAIAMRHASWGRFDVRLDDAHPAFRLIETMMNVRSRLTGICTGDQGIFVQRHLLETVGGIPLQPLMEDIELSKRLRRLARPLCITTRLTTSARRWRTHGIAKTVLLMWRLRFAYFFGAAPAALARRYYSTDD